MRFDDSQIVNLSFSAKLESILTQQMTNFRQYLREHQRWVFVGLLFLIATVNYLDRQTLSVLAPTLREKLNFSAVEYSYVVTSFLAAYLIGYLFCAQVIERIGIKTGLACALLLWSLADILHAFAYGWISLAIYRFILGLGESFAIPAGVKVISDWVAPRERGFAMALFSNGSVLGTVLAPPIIAALALNLGLEWAFIIPGTFGVMLAAVWFFKYHEPKLHPRLSAAESTYLLEIKAPTLDDNVRMSMWEMLRHPLCLGFFIARFLTDSVSYFFGFWLPEYLVHTRGFDLALIGIIVWLPYLVSAFGFQLGGSASDILVRRGWPSSKARHALLLLAVCFMPLAILIFHTSIVWLAIALIAVLLAANACWLVNLLTLVSESVSARNVATLIAFSAIGGSLGGILSTLFIGRTVETFGYGLVFYLLGSVHVIAFIVLILCRRWHTSNLKRIM